MMKRCSRQTSFSRSAPRRLISRILKMTLKGRELPFQVRPASLRLRLTAHGGYAQDKIGSPNSCALKRFERREDT